MRQEVTKRLFSVGNPAKMIEAPLPVPKATEPFYIEVVKDFEGLKRYAADIADLSGAALEQNPFFEDWMLLPAVKSFGPGLDLLFVFVFARPPSHSPRLLCGFFPLIRHHRWPGLRLRVYSLWQHTYCPLSTPLVRCDYAHECLEALFNWLAASRGGCQLIEFNNIRSDSPFGRTLSDFLQERRIPNFVFNRFARAAYQPTRDPYEQLQAALSSKYLSQLRRKQRMLSEVGSVQFAKLRPGDNVSQWINDFLKLEASGWKGSEKTALDCAEASRSFFADAAQAAFRRGRLRMIESRLDGELLALRCSFISGRESFLFKLAYNENYARFSPGVLLELENMKYLSAEKCVEDSCTVPDHPMFDRLWAGRNQIQTTLASWSKSGAAAISAMELYRWCKRIFPLRPH